MVACPRCGEPLMVRSADVLEEKIVLRARCIGCRRIWLADVPRAAFYSPDEPSGDGGETEPSVVVPR
jgi:hypothetical protein